MVLIAQTRRNLTFKLVVAEVRFSARADWPWRPVAACRAISPWRERWHALAGAHAAEIGFELGEGGEDIEEHLPRRIARVVERPAEGQFHVSFRKPIAAGISPISAKRSDIGNTPG